MDRGWARQGRKILRQTHEREREREGVKGGVTSCAELGQSSVSDEAVVVEEEEEECREWYDVFCQEKIHRALPTFSW